MSSTEQAMRCYRHPGTETAVACSNCDRPICPECMVFAAVGIKCPECAEQPAQVKQAAKRVRPSGGILSGDAPVTKVLIGLNLIVFLLQISEGDIQGNSGWVFQQGVLWLPYLAEGEWWRLVSAGFLHYGLIHILFNSVMLWWFGSPLEALLGKGRFLAIYGIGLLAGSAGALLLAPDRAVVGASAGVFAILGAGLVLERRGTMVFGGAALMVVLLNLALSILIVQISLGGHLGGLVGGMLAILALTQLGRSHASYGRLQPAAVAGLVAIAVASVALAYLRVRGYA